MGWQSQQLDHIQIICTSLHTTTPVPHHSVFHRLDALPATLPTASKHWGTLLALQTLIKTLKWWHVTKLAVFNKQLYNPTTTPCFHIHLGHCQSVLPQMYFLMWSNSSSGSRHVAPNGWMDQDATWYGGRPRPRQNCVRWGPSSPQKGHTSSPLFCPCRLWPYSRPSQLLLGSCKLMLRLTSVLN